jgi:photosystem II stability/assembly factor-like uncharacterized protein
MDMMQNPAVNVHDVQAAFNEHWDGRPYERSKGFKMFKRWEWWMEQRTYPSGVRPDAGTFNKAVKDAKAMDHLLGAKSNANWQPLGPYTWTNGPSGYNPGNGRVNCTAVDPNNASTIYAGAATGGLWKSTDNGLSWAALFTDQPSLGVSGIAIDPSNSSVIYCATGDGDGTDTYSMGVIKSTDGGSTWSATGLNWATTAARNTRMLRMSPADPQTLFCCANNGLWKTSDGGGVWAKVANGSFHDVEFKPDDPGVVYACGDQFFRSVDGGSTFSTTGVGLPAASLVNRMRIAVCAADPIKVYVLCGKETDGGYLGLYRSNDGGSNFTLRSSAPNIFGYSNTGNDSGGQSNYDMALAVDPANMNVVWVGGINVWRSVNGGANWTVQTDWVINGQSPYVHADIHSLDHYNGALYCGNDGGVFRSNDAGTTWNDLSAGLQITQFYRLGGSELVPDRIIAGAQDNGMNLWNGTDWTHVMGADGMEGAVAPDDPDIIYGCFQNGGISRSDDGGQTFHNIAFSITEEGPWVTPYVIDHNNPQVVIAGFRNLWRSTDRGSTWTQWTTVNTTRSVRAIAIAPSNSNVVYYCNDNWMRRTENNGGTWLAASTGLPDAAISSIAVDPAQPLHVFVCLSGYMQGQKVYKSTDGGGTWTNISGNLPNVPTNTIVYQEGSNDGLYVGTDLGVFYTDNTLSNWQPFGQGLPRLAVTELEINANAGKLRAATYGRGLWESDLFQAVNEPPTAAFTFTATGNCVGDPILFADASLNAAPGWTWTFDGGSPATSSEAGPAVVFNSPGDQLVSLTIANPFGPDTHYSVVPVTIEPNRLNLSFTFDDYPGETSWTITDDLTAMDVAGGGPYAGLNAGGTLNEHVCLPPGCYTFTISDSYGDGICCDNGDGAYSVGNPQQGQLASGGTFAYTQSTSFCLDLSTAAGPGMSSASVHVRPLDAEGRFLLTLPTDIGVAAVQVFDAMGRSVNVFVTRSSAKEMTVDLRSCAAGTFLVRVQCIAGAWNERLVKN